MMLTLCDAVMQRRLAWGIAYTLHMRDIPFRSQPDQLFL
jgi:hypothetical protein